MARPLRIEFPGAIYHVTSRGDRREPIFADNDDRQTLLAVVAQAMARFDAQVLAYCLMDNHYHFVLHTRAANLSRLMRHVNGVYTQAFNRRHAKAGHLLQGRFKAILVDRDAYLLEVCRYVELNPVRAKMVAEPAQWPWSSYLAHTLHAPTPAWLDTAGLHGYVLGRTPQTRADSRRAATRYARLVADGVGIDLWSQALQGQIYLGDDDFVARMQRLAAPERLRDRSAPKTQRLRPRSLQAWLKHCASRHEALRCAYVHSGLTMTSMAKELGLTIARVSQLIARAEAEQGVTE
jgi:putative transposase